MNDRNFWQGVLHSLRGVTPEHQASEPAAVLTDSQLAVLLTRLQWDITDAAHDLPAGTYATAASDALAGQMECIAAQLRLRNPSAPAESESA